MSTDERYEGWANRETWAVALHINNDQGWQESVLEQLREGPYGSEGFTLAEAREAFFNAPRIIEHMAGDLVRENVEQTLDTLYELPQAVRNVREDIGSLWRVDWTELGAAFLADLAEQGDA